MLLELGSGYRPYDDGREWIHTDLNAGPGIDFVAPAEKISLYVEPGSVEELRATHLLEHFSFTETVAVLKEWRKVLREQGTLYIEVPNFSWQTRAHAHGEIDDEQAVYYVFGEQDYPENTHYAAFTEDLLRKRLEEADFIDVQTQDIGQVILAWARKGADDDRHPDDSESQVPRAEVQALRQGL